MVLAFEGQLEAISAETGSTAPALQLLPTAADSVPGLDQGLAQFTGYDRVCG